MKANVISENKALAMVLAVMCLVIVVLVGFVFVGMNRGTNEVIEDDIETGEYTETNATPEEIAEYEKYMDTYEDVRAKARELLSQNPVDAEAITKLYSDAIDSYATASDYDNVQGFILAENEDLMSVGLKAEALDALTRIDYSIFPANIQHRRYLQIINLARELDRMDVVAKYEPLAVATEEAFAQSGAAIREASEKYKRESRGETE